MKYNEKNTPYACLMTNSTCFKGTKEMKVVGVLWHSTGADNPNLKRYVQPSDDSVNRDYDLKKLGVNVNHNDWNHMQVKAGVNAFIGKFANGEVGTVQTLPWNFRPWGCGSGTKGSCNNGWIQFEICEDSLNDKAYFDKVYAEAVELTAYLCTLYGLNPKGIVKYNSAGVPVITCHADAHDLGFASNHADVNHWFRKHGKSMETVRNDVLALINGTKAAAQSSGSSAGAPAAQPALKPETPIVSGSSQLVSQEPDNTMLIWRYLLGNFDGNSFAVAGIMGNLYAESGLRSNNLQNSYNKKYGLTDEQYTELVDKNDIAIDFVHDKAGYGLAQWTFWSRKNALLMYARTAHKSIADLGMQLDFFMYELKTGYNGVYKALRNAGNINEASDIMLLQYEKPADQSEAVKAKRRGYSMTFWNLYALADEGKVIVKPAQQTERKTEQKPVQDQKQTAPETRPEEYSAGTYVTVSGPMRIRTGPGTAYPQATFASMSPSAKSQNREYAATGLAYYKAGVRFTAKQIQKNSDGSVWAKSPSGWICIAGVGKTYCKKA